jgi:predicted phage tail protein
MKTIYLHGSLGERFGTEFKFDINSVNEGIKALCQLDGFYKTLNDGFWEIRRGDEAIKNDELVMLNMTMFSCDSIHIIPVLEGDKGSGGKSIGKIIMGVAVIAGTVMTAGVGATAGASFFGAGGAGANIAFAGITHGQLALLGGAMVLGGVSSLMTPVPSRGEYEESDTTQERNGILGGGGNTSEQGAPIPLCYGTMRTGSHVIQVGMSTETLLPVEYVYSRNSKQFEMTSSTRTYDSVNYIGAGTTIYSSGRGFSFDDDDEGYVQEYGTLSSWNFRNEAIGYIAEVEDDGLYYLDVAIRRDNFGQDLFDRIIIQDSGGTELLNKVTLSADLFERDFIVEPTSEQARALYRNNDGEEGSERVPTGRVRRDHLFARWRWNLPSSLLADATDYIIFLEYN